MSKPLIRCERAPHGIECRGYLLPQKVVLEGVQVRTVYQCTACEKQTVGTAHKDQEES